MSNAVLLDVSPLPNLADPEAEIPVGGRDAPPPYSELKSPDPASRPMPHRTSTFLQGASGFTMGQANFNNNMHVVTINQFHGRAEPPGRRCQCTPAPLPSRRQTCTCTGRSSHVAAGLNTPTQQLRFEFSQQGIGARHPDHQTSIDQAHGHVAPQVDPLAWRSEGEFREERAADEYLNQLSAVLGSATAYARKGRHRDSEGLFCTPNSRAAQRPPKTVVAEPDRGLLVGEALTTIFGEEDSRGIHYTLLDYTFFQPMAGEHEGQLLRLCPRFLPHYNGLSREGVAHLDTSVKVSLARVIEKLHQERRALGLGRALTFEIVQACLSQLIFLQTSTGDATTSFRVVKCQRGSRLARFMTEATWVVELVESSEPESILDEALTILKARKPRQCKDLKCLPVGARSCGSQDQVVLVDITVLCFPRLNVPRFKLCHLVVKCFDSKKGSLSSKVEVGAVVNYTSRFYHIRDGVVEGLASEVKKKAVTYAENLFPVHDFIEIKSI